MEAKETWSPNVILADADYLDKVAFDLTVNFERMIDRRISAADTARWLDCIALDGGIRPGDNSIQAVFLHSPDKKEMRYFRPGKFDAELDGKAFKDNLGEFTICSFSAEGMASTSDFFVESLRHLLDRDDVNRIMVVGDMEKSGTNICHVLSEAADRRKDVTLFAMEPVTGRGFYQEILGYSLMSALGIKGDEIK